MIKELLRKYLLEHQLYEAEPTGHFGDRVNEVINNIVSIQIPPTAYLSNIPKEKQDAWIISQIQTQLRGKINAVKEKQYPEGNTGICVLVPLGLIKIQSINGSQSNIIITAKRTEGLMSGFNYYIAIYDNRMPSIVLADPKNPNNSSPGNQLLAHMNNNIKRGDKVNKAKSFVDKSFMSNIVIDMRGFRGFKA